MNSPISEDIQFLRLLLGHIRLFQGGMGNVVLKDDFLKQGKMYRHKNEQSEGFIYVMREPIVGPVTDEEYLYILICDMRNITEVSVRLAFS